MPPRPKTEIEHFFFNNLQFGDSRRSHRLEDDTAEWATMKKLLVGKNTFFPSKVTI